MEEIARIAVMIVMKNAFFFIYIHILSTEYFIPKSPSI